MLAPDPIWTGIPAQNGPVAAQIGSVAQRQHGVISWNQLLACGLSRSTVGDWVRAGHLHRLHRGVYAVGHLNISREARYLAAVLAGGEGAVLSHTPAARHQRLDLTRATGTIHLTLPRDNKRSPKGILVHRPRLLDPRDTTRHLGIPTTTPTRTLYDLTPSLSANELRARFERAEAGERLDRDRLCELISQSSNHPRIANLKQLADYAPLPLSRVRSGLEAIILSACRAHSLPIPAVNVPLLGYEVDFLWPEARFVVEADGPQHRGAQRDRDNERDVSLARAGFLVRRYTEEALADRAGLGAEIRAIVTERITAHVPRRSRR